MNAQDDDGKTPLHVAACGLILPVIQHLVALGGDVNIRNHRGQLPLDVYRQAVAGSQLASSLAKALSKKSMFAFACPEAEAVVEDESVVEVLTPSCVAAAAAAAAGAQQEEAADVASKKRRRRKKANEEKEGVR